MGRKADTPMVSEGRLRLLGGALEQVRVPRLRGREGIGLLEKY